MKKLSKILTSIFLLIFLTECGKDFFKKVDNRKRPVNAQERARQNVEQGKGVSINKLLKEEVIPTFNLVLQILCGEHH